MSSLEDVYKSARAKIFEDPRLQSGHRGQVMVNLGGLLGDTGVTDRISAAKFQTVLAQCLLSPGLVDPTSIGATNALRRTLEPLDRLDLRTTYGELIGDLERAGDLSRPRREIISVLDGSIFHGN